MVYLGAEANAVGIFKLFMRLPYSTETQKSPFAWACSGTGMGPFCGEQTYRNIWYRVTLELKYIQLHTV
jgi:hypothetical protein